MSHPRYVTQLRAAIEKGFPLAGKDCISEVTYESNMPYALRFMIDNEIGGMTWIKIEKKNWALRHP